MINRAELSGLAALATLRPSDLDLLARVGRIVAFPGGHRLFSEGQPAEHCWLIRSGQVVLDARVPGRGDVVIQALGPGDLLGWSWLVPPRRWHFGARTVAPTEAAEFDATALTELAEADPAFGYALARALFEAVLERLQSTRARVLDLYANPGADHAR
jgi:CRP/FNR family transcriptional regulator, cyclic AMP receptor protein